MTVLDELRAAMQQDIDHTPGHEETDEGYREGVSDALLRLAQFEAAHPGLVDLAVCNTACPACRPFTSIFEMPERGYEGCVVMYTDSLYQVDHAPIGEPCPFCPACAKEAEHADE